MSSEYEIQLDNKHNILFEVASDGVISINSLSLKDPHFNTMRLTSGALQINENGNIDTSGNVTILGDLTVKGTHAKLEVVNKVIKDNIIELSYETTGIPNTDSGFVINRGDYNNSCLFWNEGAKSFSMGLTTSDASDNKINSTPFFSVSKDSMFLTDGSVDNYSISTTGVTDLSFNTNGGSILFGTNKIDIGNLPIGPLSKTSNALFTSITTNTTSIKATTSTGLDQISTSSNESGNGAILTIFATGSLNNTAESLVNSITTNNTNATLTNGPNAITNVSLNGGSGSGAKVSFGISGKLSKVANSLLPNITTNTGSITPTTSEGQKNISIISSPGSGAKVTIFASGTLKSQNITNTSSITSPTDARNGTVNILSSQITGGSGTGATLTLTVTGNQVTNVTITSGGSGYYVDDILTISANSIPATNGGNSNSNCTFKLDVNDINATVITGITVTSEGSGFFKDDQITINKTDVSGADVNAIITLDTGNIISSGITNMLVTTVGSGYYVGDILTINASDIPSTGVSNDVKITLVENNIIATQITSVNVTFGGNSYKINDQLIIDKANLPGADRNIEFTLKADDISTTPSGPLGNESNELLGSITQNTNSIDPTNDAGVLVTNTSTSGNGSGVNLRVKASGSISTTANALVPSITNNTVEIDTGTQYDLPTTTSGEGKNCRVNITASGTTVVTGITVVNGGSGYHVGDTLVVSKDHISGSIQDLKMVLQQDDIVSTIVTGVDVANGGINYTVGDTVTVLSTDLPGADRNLIFDLQFDDISNSNTDFVELKANNGAFKFIQNKNRNFVLDFQNMASGKTVTLDASNNTTNQKFHLPNIDPNPEATIITTQNLYDITDVSLQTITVRGLANFEGGVYLGDDESDAIVVRGNLCFGYTNVPDLSSTIVSQPTRNTRINLPDQDGTIILRNNSICNIEANTINFGSGTGGPLVTTANALLTSIVKNTTSITSGTYSGLPTITSGSGSNATITITASGNTTVTAVTVVNAGSGYKFGDTITIEASNIPGSDTDLVFQLQSEDINSINSSTVALKFRGNPNIDFAGSTGNNKINLTDNLANALDIIEGSNSYMKFVTTNSDEKVEFSKSIVVTSGGIKIGDGTTIGSATTTDALTIASNGKITVKQNGLEVTAGGIKIGDGTTIGSATTTDALTIASNGKITVKQNGLEVTSGGIKIGDGTTIGSATTTDAITIASNGKITVKQNGLEVTAGGIKIGDGTTIGSATTTDALTIASNGGVTIKQNGLTVTAGGIKLNNNKLAISGIQGSATTWLRLNSNKDFGAGVYTPGIFRADGGMLVGDGVTQGFLTVTGSTNKTLNARYYNSATDTYTGIANDSRPLSIYTSHMIACSELQVFSDERIKDNIEEVPDDLALEKVRQIECKYYNYKDRIGLSNDKVIGFIAQQVKEVFPMAVSINSRIIPNVYKIIKNIQWVSVDVDNITKYKMSSSELTDCINVPYMFYVSNNEDYSDETSVIIKENSDDCFIFEKEWNFVFCYGYEVNDFHHLEKNKIFTLHHAAIQEIDKKQQSDNSEILDLKIKNQQLEAKVTTLEQQLSEILARISNLENN